MEYKGYRASVTFDDEAEVFFGRVVHLRDIITFQSDSVVGLKKEFRISVDGWPMRSNGRFLPMLCSGIRGRRSALQYPQAVFDLQAAGTHEWHMNHGDVYNECAS